MTTDFTGTIRPCSDAAKCPLCNEFMQSYENCETVTAHALQMLAHSKCADKANKDTDANDFSGEEDDE